MDKKKDDLNEEELWKSNRILLTIPILVLSFICIQQALYIARNDNTTCLQDVQHGGQISTVSSVSLDKRELAEVNHMTSEVNEYSNGLDDGNDLIEYVNIELRNKWIWTSLIAGGIILAAATSLATVWAPALVAGSLGRIIRLWSD
ncbi:hypothetical protein CANMA_003403 [Candida margitis]|uniref:uncharacterized protein n=1 Tax=Candida margitis TaxID=1775924 RepID=UPI002226865E|nr:uncharacterized protein CANMA_003403 [Candida margitis]KAI5965433.1 hypothetical protein CANMA_003403 [Candida margitis]